MLQSTSVHHLHHPSLVSLSYYQGHGGPTEASEVFSRCSIKNYQSLRPVIKSNHECQGNEYHSSLGTIRKTYWTRGWLWAFFLPKTALFYFRQKLSSYLFFSSSYFQKVLVYSLFGKKVFAPSTLLWEKFLARSFSWGELPYHMTNINLRDLATFYQNS